MNEQNSKKLLQIYDIRDKLNEKLQNIIKQQDEERRLVNQEYQQSISQVDDEYCQKFNRFSYSMSNMKFDQRKFKEVLKQSEKDYKTFYKESQQSLKAKLEEFNTQTEILRSSISRFKKEIVRYENRKEILHNLKKRQRINKQNQKLRNHCRVCVKN